MKEKKWLGCCIIVVDSDSCFISIIMEYILVEEVMVGCFLLDIFMLYGFFYVLIKIDN